MTPPPLDGPTTPDPVTRDARPVSLELRLLRRAFRQEHRAPRPPRPRADWVLGLPVRRDPVVDLVRAICLTVVIAVHTVLAGLWVAADGTVVFGATLEGVRAFEPVSWIVQVMPLFFIAGGFSGLSSWTAIRARGGTAREFIRGRVERLAAPTVLLVVVVSLALLVAGLAGMPAGLIAESSWRMAQPLWFLASYAVVSALVPVMSSLHLRAPYLTVLALGAVGLGVDLLRMSTGVTAWGLINYVVVWTAVQQLGFWLAASPLRTAPHRVHAAVAFAAFALLLGMSLLGWPAEMFIAANSPTSAGLLVLGILQLALLMLLSPALQRALDWHPLARLSRWINARSMSLYLWHMPVVVLCSGIWLGIGAWLPVPLSAEWWLSRPLFLALVFAGTALVSLAVRRAETVKLPPSAWLPELPRTVGVTLAGLGALSAGFAATMLLMFGFGTPLGTGLSLGLYLIAVVLCRLGAASPPAPV